MSAENETVVAPVPELDPELVPVELEPELVPLVPELPPVESFEEQPAARAIARSACTRTGKYTSVGELGI